MPLQSAALLRIQYIYSEGKSLNPIGTYNYGPFNFLISSEKDRDKFWPLPKMMTHDGYEVHQAWKRDAGQRYYERFAGDCAFVGNFYPEGE